MTVKRIICPTKNMLKIRYVVGQALIRGKQLLDLCIQSSLRIMNCRTLGDFQEKFTSYNSQGCSIIDYVLCSEEFL